MIVSNPTIPYTTVYCPPMTYEFIIPQRRREVKRKLVIRTHESGLDDRISRVPSSVSLLGSNVNKL